MIKYRQYELDSLSMFKEICPSRQQAYYILLQEMQKILPLTNFSIYTNLHEHCRLRNDSEAGYIAIKWDVLKRLVYVDATGEMSFRALARNILQHCEDYFISTKEIQIKSEIKTQLDKLRVEAYDTINLVERLTKELK